MRPRSNTLFHFTRSLDYLQGILKSGFHPRYCLEDMRWSEVKFVAIPMVCFCDIPISRISEHTAFYGSYGIGVSKEWAIKNLLQPLIYTPAVSPIVNLLTDVMKLSEEKLKPFEKDFPIDTHFQNIVSLVKPLSGDMVVGEGVVTKDFYQENEWRYVPPQFDPGFREDFSSKRDELNASVEKYALKFLPNDIRYIFVRSESEIPVMFDFINNSLGHWPHNDIKILTSRITSLETLADDM